MLLFVMLSKDALISVMVRRLPTTPQTPNPGLASQSSSPSHRCRERGLLLLGGLSQSFSPSHWQHAAAERGLLLLGGFHARPGLLPQEGYPGSQSQQRPEYPKYMTK